MKRLVVWLCFTVLLISACSPQMPAPSSPQAGPDLEGPSPVDPPPTAVPAEAPPKPASVTPAGGQFVTYLKVESIGDIAVQVMLPERPRYQDGAGIVVSVDTFLTPGSGFNTDPNVTSIGLIQVSYLWPGTSDRSGPRSEGNFDYGGPDSIKALRDVIRFASGQIPDREGHFLEDLIEVVALKDNVGLYAFSHPGQAAVNVLALHGSLMPEVDYLVGRENPTQDTLTAVEVGFWGENNVPVLNPLYVYPDSYTPTLLIIDYRAIAWDPDYREEGGRYVGRPYFDLNGNGIQDGSDHALGSRVPSAYGERMYSAALTQALRANGAIHEADWPEDLMSPERVVELWAFQDNTRRYPDLRTQTPDLKVMLVFARRDHVQPAPDKPHIHQAFDGFFHAAGLWTRMNPDPVYVGWLNPELGARVPDNRANSEPANWIDIDDWAYPNMPAAMRVIPLAAVAEMADRVHENVWTDDLDGVLVDFAAPDLRP